MFGEIMLTYNVLVDRITTQLKARPPVVIDEKDLNLSSIPIISKEISLSRAANKERTVSEFETFRKSWEKRREDEKTHNEEIKTELRIDLEKRRKDFNEMQLEEAKKRDQFNKKAFPDQGRNNF